MMKSFLSAVMIAGVASLGFSSCATVPNKPLVPGELRLLGLIVPDRENIKLNSVFTVNILFEAEGRPEVRAACFTLSGDGPHCSKVTEVDYGSPGTIRSHIRTRNPGSRLLEGYVLYVRGGKIQATNTVSTYFRLAPQ
jgi:hypothetical protein